MRLKDIGDDVLFDEFPLAYNSKQKIILTHLYHLEEQTLPAKLPHIYTTAKLAKQLRCFCDAKGSKCLTKDNFVLLDAYEPLDMVISKRKILQILLCEANDTSGYLMVLIKEDGRLTHLYGGNFTDIRTALLNDTFASWIGQGVERLYVNLRRSEEDHKSYELSDMYKATERIEEILSNHNEGKILVHVPLFGYENFINNLADCLRKRVALTGLLQKLYSNLTADLDNFCDDSSKARIIVIPGQSKFSRAGLAFKNQKNITVNVTANIGRAPNTEKVYFHELRWSPEPTPFDLQLLCLLVKPKRIYGIVDLFNMTTKVPRYLLELCPGAKEAFKRREQEESESFRNTQEPQIVVLGTNYGHLLTRRNPFLNDSESDDD